MRIIFFFRLQVVSSPGCTADDGKTFMKIEFSTMSDWSPVSEYYVRFVVSDSSNRAGRHSELTLDADKMPSSKIASKQSVTRSRPRLI